MHGTDKDWNEFGRRDPYWAVITDERFRKEVMNVSSRNEFFESGEAYVDWMLSIIRTRVVPNFKPDRVLDFGCGVGRLLLPFAKRGFEVVGADVAESMLKEAERNVISEKLTNVTLVKEDDRLSRLSGRFDLINSYIVFQHIPCRRGQRLFRRIVNLLRDDGVAVIHFTYSKTGFRHEAGITHSSWAISDLSAVTRRAYEVCARFKERLRDVLHKNPMMQMNQYNLNSLFHTLQSAGMERICVEFTDHGGELGVVLFFQRPAMQRNNGPKNGVWNTHPDQNAVEE